MDQLDMFDPAHVALLNAARYNYSLAAPHSDLCPHDNISDKLIYHEDEYGRDQPSWTDIRVECEFCKKVGMMNLEKYRKSKLSIMDVLLGGYNTK
jgi:hypothetical protein